jgi:hypothetical protein
MVVDDGGAHPETVTISTVGTAGAAGSGVTFSPALAFAHSIGGAVTPNYPPFIVSTQSNSPSAQGITANAECGEAQGTGDTHLLTFNGLLYDFQAQGDFTYASAPSFVVQTRQVSGAPRWPNAAVNSAVATQMGDTRVAVCLPDRLVVNGVTNVLKQGQPLVRPDGVRILHTGNVYLIRSQRGDSLTARVNTAVAPAESWIDVSVGLGSSREKVRGLLANAGANVNQLATQGGAIVTVPSMTFKQLYAFGDTWLVPPSTSLLNVCGSPLKTPPKHPEAAFYAKNLKPAVAGPALATCVKAGVRDKALLDACTLDVAVTGTAGHGDGEGGERLPRRDGSGCRPHPSLKRFPGSDPFG